MLGSFNNGVLFIRGHLDVEVGKPCDPSTLQSQLQHIEIHTSVSVKFYVANNKNRGKKQLKEVFIRMPPTFTLDCVSFVIHANDSNIDAKIIRKIKLMN